MQDYTACDKVCEWPTYIMLLEHTKGHLARSGKVRSEGFFGVDI